MPLTTLGRGISTSELEELPVAGREVASLAILLPGIGAMPGTMRTTAVGITAAGQTNRNNTFLIDGLSIDDNRNSNIRGTLSLDAISKFMVLSNSYSAEYGQASGAVISLVTRFGSNQNHGRLFYYHRDDRWDATPGAAYLVSPPERKYVASASARPPTSWTATKSASAPSRSAFACPRAPDSTPSP